MSFHKTNKICDSTFSPKQHDARKAIFAENLKLIKIHNAEHEAGLHTFTVAVNQFADMTNAEFVQQFNGFKKPSSFEKKNRIVHHHDGPCDDLPTEVDWRKEVPIWLTGLSFVTYSCTVPQKLYQTVHYKIRFLSRDMLHV